MNTKGISPQRPIQYQTSDITEPNSNKEGAKVAELRKNLEGLFGEFAKNIREDQTHATPVIKDNPSQEKGLVKIAEKIKESSELKETKNVTKTDKSDISKKKKISKFMSRLRFETLKITGLVSRKMTYKQFSAASLGVISRQGSAITKKTDRYRAAEYTLILDRAANHNKKQPVTAFLLKSIERRYQNQPQMKELLASCRTNVVGNPTYASSLLFPHAIKVELHDGKLNGGGAAKIKSKASDQDISKNNTLSSVSDEDFSIEEEEEIQTLVEPFKQAMSEMPKQYNIVDRAILLLEQEVWSRDAMGCESTEKDGTWLQTSQTDNETILNQTERELQKHWGNRDLMDAGPNAKFSRG